MAKWPNHSISGKQLQKGQTATTLDKKEQSFSEKKISKKK
jgi:hypothetical protein